MLNFHLARDKVTENFHITERALLATFLNRLAAVRLKIEQERLEKFLVKQVTRVMPVAVRVATATTTTPPRMRAILPPMFMSTSLAPLRLQPTAEGYQHPHDKIACFAP
jgi:hypothetical protein